MFSKHVGFLVLFMLFFTFFYSSAVLAISDEEMTYLRMYFKDDDLEVVSATRSLKTISRVAENVTVITALDIELMNAHMVAEALYNVTGIAMQSFVGPGAFGLPGIHGSNYNRVAVFIDGVPIQGISDAVPTGIIPVQMISRIEIVKGPASSTWGSSFGGVINIITKSASPGNHLNGMLYASGGEHNTSDLRAEFNAKKGSLGLYLFTGTMNSGGLMNNHDFWHNNLFSKVSLAASHKTSIDLSLLYHKSDTKQYDNLAGDYYEARNIENINGRLAVTSNINDNLDLNLSGWVDRQHTFSVFNTLSTGDTFYDGVNEYNKHGVSGSLTLRTGSHTIVAGVDYLNGRFRTNFAPDGFVKQRRKGFFINDTIKLGDLSVIPGVRYDDTNLGGDFVSPSLGMTYRLTKDLLLRASVARGFHSISPGDYIDYPGWPANHSLTPERIMSYQVGAEANIGNLMWAKLVVFRHDISDLVTQITLDNGDNFTVNAYKQQVYGGETDIKSRAYHGFTLGGGLSYENIRLIDFSDPGRQFDVTNQYDINTSVTYNNNRGLRAIIKSKYTWLNLPGFWEAKYNGFITDFNVIKDIVKNKSITLDVFLTAHNIFNEAGYTQSDNMNPSRWIEAGMRLGF